MPDDLHLERLDQTHGLGPDIAEPDHAQGPSAQPEAHVIDLLRPADRPAARQPILDQQLAGDRQDHGDQRGRHGTAHGLRRDRQCDAGVAAGLGVDGVVADAEAGHEGEAPARPGALCCEALAVHDDGVELRQVRRPQHGVVADVEFSITIEVGVLELTGRLQWLQVDGRKGRRAVGLDEVAAQRDPELFRCHGVTPSGRPATA